MLGGWISTVKRNANSFRNLALSAEHRRSHIVQCTPEDKRRSHAMPMGLHARSTLTFFFLSFFYLSPLSFSSSACRCLSATAISIRRNVYLSLTSVVGFLTFRFLHLRFGVCEVCDFQVAYQ